MPMVSYDLDNLPEVPKEERVKLAAMSDEDINYSDIPEINDFAGFVRAENQGEMNLSKIMSSQRLGARGSAASACGACLTQTPGVKRKRVSGAVWLTFYLCNLWTP
jgi:hypothetical protein